MTTETFPATCTGLVEEAMPGPEAGVATDEDASPAAVPAALTKYTTEKEVEAMKESVFLILHRCNYSSHTQRTQ